MFTSKTWYEHALAFHLDYYEKRPLEAHRQADGHIQFTNTGDSLIDKWEEQIARGEEPDLTEAFNKESLDQVRRFSKRRRKNGVASFKDLHDSLAADAKRSGLAMPGGTPRPLPTFPTSDE